ncbi:MAG: RpiB/LacA/LacB family sugar-phosphate isomerase [Patescibacteria group bacterium]
MEKTLKTIIIGADHRGWQAKEDLKRSIAEWGYLIADEGAHAYDVHDDYPDIAYAVALRVAQEDDMQGVLLCGSGVGMSVVANKVQGIRASLCFFPEQAAAAKHDDDANVLVLSVDYLTAAQMRRILKSWLDTDFAPKEKYMRRLRKITLLETQGYLKNVKAQSSNAMVRQAHHDK